MLLSVLVCWLRVLISSPAVNAINMSFKRTGVFLLFASGFLFLFILAVCQKDSSLASQEALCVAFCLWRISSSQHERVFRVTFIYLVAKCY